MYSIAVVAACPFPYPRGTPIRILRMAEALRARGHNVEIITYHLGQSIPDLSFPIHRTPNIPTYHKLSPGPSWQKLLVMDMLLCLKLISVMRSQKFDIIHAHHYEGLIASIPAARLMKKPLIFDVHTLLSSELPYYSMGLPPRILQRMADFLDHWLPARADHVVTVTNTIRRRLIEEIGIDAHDATTVYTGMDSGFIQAPGSLDLQSKPVTLIYAGNLAAYQGIDLMLQAFRIVLDHRPQVQLKLITDSPLSAYDGLISRLALKDVLCIEPTDYFTLPDQLRSAPIALNPRVKCDGLPMKVLNYMATGRAIVSFAGSAEALENEKTALIVQDNDVGAFASAIIRLLDEPELAMNIGNAAHNAVQDFFMWPAAVNLLEGIYARFAKPS